MATPARHQRSPGCYGDKITQIGGLASGPRLLLDLCNLGERHGGKVS